MSRTFELFAAEYGWTHRMIREQFTARQLRLYSERLTERYKQQNPEPQERGAVNWDRYVTAMRASGEVTYVQGVG